MILQKEESSQLKIIKSSSSKKGVINDTQIIKMVAYPITFNNISV